MGPIEEILRSDLKPKEKQTRLVVGVVSGQIPVDVFIAFFELARAVDKGTCADVMKQISAQKPELLVPYVDILVGYINSPLPRVMWGVPEAIGNMAKEYPDQAAKAIPNLLKNTTADKINTTVIRWCAAYALGEIAKHNPDTRTQLLPLFEQFIESEENSGVRNVYIKALKTIRKK